MTYQELLSENFGQKPGWWEWRNFTPKEVSCKCCGEIWRGDVELPPIWFMNAMATLQRLRDRLGRPLIVNSAHRCEKHNAEVGGVANSQHFTHIAFDVRCPYGEQQEFAKAAHVAGFRFVLTYPDRGFVHLDMRMGK